MHCELFSHMLLYCWQTADRGPLLDTEPSASLQICCAEVPSLKNELCTISLADKYSALSWVCGNQHRSLEKQSVNNWMLSNNRHMPLQAQ